ncbi:B3 domain-containing transcription repressor VAL1 [Striga hermonthica]|uniref:B3 domain-containing transcription repressor VAL1 n=1 Tax=Striga hermonthica TaxID=68872 RepID=A0A9N7RQX2_STRHE|nr:B3 domain-containing transcription repressor VAL1 [Striga hermonthica]
MGMKNCMNEVCRATTSSDWKKGWTLKSGGLASLCYNCGSAYENSIFCETFHAEDSGWRPCRVCGKVVHCGCIASRHLHEYMDFGGVACISCVKRLEIHAMQTIQIPGDVRNGTFAPKSIFSDPQPMVIGNRIDDDKFSTERLLQLTKSIGVNDITSAFEQLKRDEPPMLKTPEIGTNLASPSLQPSSSVFIKPENIGPRQGSKDMTESLTQPCLNFSLSAIPPIAGSSSLAPFPGGMIDGSDQNKGSLQRIRHIPPKPPKPSPTAGPEASKGSSSQARVPRPPAEGRGRSQLLPRYWPRITDQELQQLSGDLNSTIVPLFEKILSASDAGRIGRLVLPKACAEAYFPTINQSEGIPIKIQDIKGKEWTFQFRFWPNNNSRMYVLEGVTPCIQSMQVQAGDTVIFSRRDPGGQLVIGCRKAVVNFDVQQEPQTPATPIADPPGDTSSSGGNDNKPANGGRVSDDSRQQHMSMLEKRNARNIKNKRLHMHNDDAVELRITWEEAQELLRPPASTEPTVVMVEHCEIEEFEEPPVFGKRTIFISQPNGEQAQLAQCDSCSKWRRLPVHALISANWACAENVWDITRSSCSAPEEISLRNQDFSRTNKDHKKQKNSNSKAAREGEPSGLDALANAAVLGDNIAGAGDYSTGPTTRHPRHRPGCTCIVCIQPPSGKGRHEPSCKCNVCLTVKRQEEEKPAAKQDLEREDIVGHTLRNMNQLLKEIGNSNNNDGMKQVDNVEDVGKAGLDLNCDPHREDEILAGTSGMSLTSLINTAGFPLDMYLGQNGLPGLGPGPGPVPSPLVPRALGGVDDNGGHGSGSGSGDGKQETGE